MKCTDVEVLTEAAFGSVSQCEHFQLSDLVCKCLTRPVNVAIDLVDDVVFGFRRVDQRPTLSADLTSNLIRTKDIFTSEEKDETKAGENSDLCFSSIHHEQLRLAPAYCQGVTLFHPPTLSPRS